MQAEIRNRLTTLAELLAESARTYGERPALVKRIGLRDDVWSYRRLAGTAWHVAHQLFERHGLRPGAKVLIQGANAPQLAAVYLACLASGIVVVPLDPFSTPEFVSRIAASVGAAAFLGDAKPEGLAVPYIDPGGLDFSDASAVQPPAAPQPDAIAEIIFTSGTTGQPKGVVLTHRNLLTSVRAIQDVYPNWPKLRFLTLLPLSHMFEQCVGLFAPLVNGATLYYPDGRNSAAMLRKLAQKRIHGVVAVPQILDLLLQAVERELAAKGRQSAWASWTEIVRHLPFPCRRPATDLLFPEAAALPKFFVSGGAALPPPLEARLEGIGIRVIQGYGATECAPVIARNRFDKRIHGSAGWPAPGVEIKLSKAGEILVKGENVTPGYWQNSDATAAAFTEDGFYRTSDFGEIGSRGEIYVRGRCNNAIILASGLNVFPEDIEPVVGAQPGISSCVVMSLPAAGGPEALTAVVRLTDEQASPDMQLETANRAIRGANAALAPHQRLAGVRIWNGEFPLTSMLKIKRWKVREALVNAGPETNSAAAAPEAESLGALEKLLAGVCRVPAQNISDNSDLDFDLGLDSLGRVELALLIERELGVHLDDAELIGIRRVGDLKDLIRRSEKAPPAARFSSWPLAPRASGIRQMLQSFLLFPLHRSIGRTFTVTGTEHLENLPLPALFIANHSSHIDTASILRALPGPIRKRLAVAAAADYFFANRLAAASLQLSINAFPFAREGSIRPSLEYCGELTDAGWSVLIYPEGTRSTTGRLLDFKPGIGFLATGLGVPVVPIAVAGGYEILPKGAVWPRRGDIRVHFGAPVQVPADADKLEATLRLQEALAQLIDAQERKSSPPSQTLIQARNS